MFSILDPQGRLKVTDFTAAGFPLPAANGGTGLSTYAVGDLIYAATTTTLATRAAVAAGAYLRSAGVNTAPIWSTLLLPNAATANQVVYATATNTYGASANLTFDGNTLALNGSSNIVITNTSGACMTVSKSNNQPVCFQINGTAGNAQSMSMISDVLTFTKNDGLTPTLSITQAGLVYMLQPKFGTGSTGAGSAALGANCPATTLTAPYTWITAQSADGSTVRIPAWK